MQTLKRTLWTLLFWAAAGGAWAQSCTISSASPLGSAFNYDPFNAGFNDTQGAFSITCTRPTGGQNKFPGTFYVGATNGSNYSGGTRRMAFGANYLSYALYMNFPNCNTAWGAAALAEVYQLPNTGTGPNNATTVPNPLANNRTFCVRITGGANTAPPGIYTDTVQIAVAESPIVIWGQLAVQITTTISPACYFNAGLPAINLTYTSFQTGNSSGTSSFELKCTNTTTYTVGFDTPSGTVLGLNYNLAAAPGTGTGTGVTQTPPGHTVTATIPSGQGGTCSGPSCSGTASRSVVITY